ncbi:MAG: hypothetical protein WCV85_04820 [Patescibacteria group bacterium]|jgi:hypothetical protein
MHPILPSIPKAERPFAFWIATAAIILGVLPLVLGALWLRKGDVFMGFSTLAPSDTNVYFSMMEQARTTGHVFFTNVFTPEAQRYAFFQPLWAILGFLAGVFHLPNAILFHLVKIFLAGIFLWIAYKALLLFIEKSLQRRIAFVALAFGMGLGGYVSPFLHLTSLQELLTKNPVDMWVSEAFTFTTLLHSPLFIISQILLLLTFLFAVRDEQSPGTVPHFIFAGLTALLGILHPYDLPVIFCVLIILPFVRILYDRAFSIAKAKRSIVRLAIMGLVTAGIGAYFIAVYQIEPALGGWAKQNITTSPPIWNYCIGYGFLLVFAVWGWLRVVRLPRSLPMLFLLAWAPMHAFLLYVPVQIQRRFTNGLHIVFAILASFALVFLWEQIIARTQNSPLKIVWRSGTVWLAILLLCYSPLYLMARDISRSYVYTPGEWSLYMQPKTTLETMDWLKTQPPGITLSVSTTSYILSGRTLLPTYFAHGHQTLGYFEKQKGVYETFTTPEGNPEAFLRQEGIRYFFWTELEKEQFEPFSPEGKSYLKLIHDTPSAKVYEVLPPA